MHQEPIYYDPTRALTEDWRSFFLDHRDAFFTLPCEDGDVVVKGNWMLLNIMQLIPLIQWRMPISRKHLFLEGIYSATTQAKVLTLVAATLIDAGKTSADISHDLIMTVMNAHNMCYTHLGESIRTMDIFSIADTVLQDEAVETCTMRYSNIEDGDIIRMEKEFKEQSKAMLDLMGGDTLPVNIFRAPLLCKALKPDQFAQFVLSAGPRTDTDEHMFRRPVVGSFLSGLFDEMDLAIESRSAAKSTHYNSQQMPATQYQNRKISIQTSVVANIYPGDCGTPNFIKYVPTAKTVARFIGKFFVASSGALLELTKQRYDMVIDREVLFRDPITCLHADGYCEVCGGTITKAFKGMGNVGFLANVNTGAPVAQQVLSTKHLISTNAAQYEVPERLNGTLIAETNDIYLRPFVRRRVSNLALGFQPKDLAKLYDLQYHVGNDVVSADRFTSLKYLVMGHVRQDGSIQSIGTRVPMKGDSEIYPHLSPEVLNTIRNHPDDVVEQGGLTWVLLRNIDVNAPIMKCTVVNNSIKKFVSDFTEMITKDITRYRSANDFMRDMTELLWQRVDTHVTHAACLVKACLITSRKDLHVPVVTDPDNVMFGTLYRNIAMRSIGAMLAFERYNQITNKPATYITPKRHSTYDEFMGTTDLIARDMDWPPMPNRLEEEIYD